MKEWDKSASKLAINSLIDHFTTDIELKLLSLPSLISPTAIQHAPSSRFDRHLHELLSLHYGCVLAYDEGLESDDAVLASAFWRNMYGMSDQVGLTELEKMVEYVRWQVHSVWNVPVEDLLRGDWELRLPPRSGGGADVSISKVVKTG